MAKNNNLVRNFFARGGRGTAHDIAKILGLTYENVTMEISQIHKNIHELFAIDRCIENGRMVYFAKWKTDVNLEEFLETSTNNLFDKLVYYFKRGGAGEPSELAAKFGVATESVITTIYKIKRSGVVELEYTRLPNKGQNRNRKFYKCKDEYLIDDSEAKNYEIPKILDNVQNESKRYIWENGVKYQLVRVE